MIDPQGLQNRSRGSRRLRRFPIISAGPNEQWSMDGHDKLAMWGFGIYGIRDVYSGFLLALHAFPSNRLAANVHWLFLETILEQKGYPIQVASDRGSEMGQISETQFLLRQTYSTPELDDVPPHICLKSLRNITIERQWVHVRKEVVDLILEKIQEGLERGFVWTNPAHRSLFWWLFAPLVQGLLAQHVTFHNSFRVRRQPTKPNPSGGRRQDFFKSPEKFGGVECLQRIQLDTIREIMEIRDKAVTEGMLRWISEEEEKICLNAHWALGASAACWTLHEVWNLFEQMVPLTQAHLTRVFEQMEV
ncbi:hypothetical protein TREMEDRAFT_29091 [Tremella mesenterica DSM 1558]|uniref:uncharacterized protein n=1 Tax=Tremella mesenterica (strain ATCC 24925 / CBS 8224 / DSM 1558 / NBRC 9311 / NRRL Y-6157 / RJB 2259-6 / UBC 559-6) TaxID=578456 RepID=UPI0003F49B82|nr:uncharacterized protein TREMEDRAFT_29091 [Tremella mesenterica DSM 1558]EIW70460.1 hypothetical protein TREMEDRAFT_29091 [Tremella mesenterica DSM 1558]